jgi:hypothetical protein
MQQAMIAPRTRSSTSTTVFDVKGFAARLHRQQDFR